MVQISKICVDLKSTGGSNPSTSAHRKGNTMVGFTMNPKTSEELIMDEIIRVTSEYYSTLYSNVIPTYEDTIVGLKNSGAKAKITAIYKLGSGGSVAIKVNMALVFPSGFVNTDTQNMRNEISRQFQNIFDEQNDDITQSFAALVQESLNKAYESGYYKNN